MSFKKSYKYIAWFVWVIFLINALRNIANPFINPLVSFEKPTWVNMLNFFLIIVSLVEGGLTIIIRYLALIRPFKKGSYSPYKGPLRFLFVGIINWICSVGMVICGTVIYSLSGEIWPVIFFGCLGLALLIYHSPRLGPFKDSSVIDTEVIDAPYSEIK